MARAEIWKVVKCGYSSTNSLPYSDSSTKRVDLQLCGSICDSVFKNMMLSELRWYVGYVGNYVGLVAWCSGNAFHSINEVTVCWARLVLRWVTACEQVNHFCM